MTKMLAPYGTWCSPVTADVITQKCTTVVDVIVDPISSTVYNLEARPSEGGRCVVLKTESGEDVFGEGWNARSSVQGYGGAAVVAYSDTIYFSHLTDARVYRVSAGTKPEPITPENANHCFTDFTVHPSGIFLVAILEDHTNPSPPDIITTLCVINTQTKVVSTIASGADFYAAPRFSPDGQYIAWQQWYHPDMPWEGSEIHVAKVAYEPEKGSHPTLTVTNARCIAGRPGTVGVMYPFWASKEHLIFTCDESGYQNPWSYSVSSDAAKPIFPVPVQEDFSEPSSTLGHSTGTALDDQTLLYSAIRDGRSMLYRIDIGTGSKEGLQCPFVHVSWVRRVSAGTAAFVGAKTTEPARVVRCTVAPTGPSATFTDLSSTTSGPSAQFPRSLVSEPRPMTLQLPPNNEPLHIVFYPPNNPNYDGSSTEGERPPCVVNVHGGPTSRSVPALDWMKQYFTSRGWGWVDVNFRGSSGYGRKYIEKLEGKWGVVDVQDCVRAAEHLASTLQLIDPKRTVIRGGSGGGYTTLAALCGPPDAFAAGTSLFGISDLSKLAEDTHKFELRRIEKLIGGRPADIPDVYRERSPVFHADMIKAPLLILQGSEDKAVPPSQAESMVETIRKRGGRVEYILFDGEGHGFRKAENQKKALEKELGFYCDVLGIKVAEAA